MSWNLISGYTSCIRANHCFTVFSKKKTWKGNWINNHQHYQIVKIPKSISWRGKLLECGEIKQQLQPFAYTVSLYFKRSFFQYAQENFILHFNAIWNIILIFIVNNRCFHPFTLLYLSNKSWWWIEQGHWFREE